MTYNVFIRISTYFNLYLLGYQSTYLQISIYLLVRCQAVLVAALVSLATGQREDDFSCPDQHIGFYPHLYR